MDDKNLNITYATGFYNDLVEWLQVNVGRLMWSRPIMEWHGEGWHMEWANGTAYKVTIDNEKLSLMFTLRWS